MNPTGVGLPMVDKHEPPRMKLADEGLGPIEEHLPAGSGRIVTPAAERYKCALCGGEMLRSRVRFYERPWVIWSNTRPYRCMECAAREWRQSR